MRGEIERCFSYLLCKAFDHNSQKPLHFRMRKMYGKRIGQHEFEDFYLPFSGGLRSDNRWVTFAKLIPWSEFEKTYSQHFSSTGQGAPSKPVRVALGALIIKERLGLSDEETVEQIRENPYLQYFLGSHEFQEEALFDPSMFVYFRKRFDGKTLAAVNERIIQLAQEQEAARAKKEASKSNKEKNDPPSSGKKGKLIIDATCAPSDIAYPTDLNLLNDAREKAETIIDVLHAPLKGHYPKPRTYRRRARKDYLSAAKCRRLSTSKRRKAVRKQLGYLRRDLKHIETLSHEVSLKHLTCHQYYNLLVANELYRQQWEMYSQRSNRIDDRIVSISQPHIRPIVRGKVKSPTEFGAKLSLAVVDGYAYPDRISWDAYNEAGDLVMHTQRYRDRYGCYPVSIHADKIYRTLDNRRFCKRHGIRLSGPPLGRPPKITDENRAEMVQRKRQHRQDELDRIEVEGKFGVAKRRYGLGRVMTKLAVTSESAIVMTFLVMNLMKLLRNSFLRFWGQRFIHLYDQIGCYGTRFSPDRIFKDLSKITYWNKCLE